MPQTSSREPPIKKTSMNKNKQNMGLILLISKNIYEYMDLIGNTRTRNSSLSNPIFLILSLHNLNLLTLWVRTMTLRFLLTLVPKSTLECLLWFCWLWSSSSCRGCILDIIWISSCDLSTFVNYEHDFVLFKLFKSFGISCLWSFQVFDLWNFSIP